jgi:PAS domain S-box-containing protein
MSNPHGPSRNHYCITEEAKNFARSITDTVREPLLILNRDFQIVSASESFYTRFRVTADMAEGTLLFELDNDQWDIPGLKKLLQEVVSEQKKIQDHQITSNFKDLGCRSFLVNVNLLNSKIVEDDLVIISFKEVIVPFPELQQKGYLKKLQNILENAPAMICILKGPQHIFEVANEHYYQLIGKQDIIGKPVREVLPEVENQGFFEILDTVYTSGKPFIGNELQINLEVENGAFKNSFLDFVYQPMLDDNGEVDGIFVHVVDVTEKVEVRKKVEENEIRLKNLIDTVPAIIWITSKDGYSTYLNENWYKYTGQNTREAENFGWLKAVHPEDRDEAGNQFLNASKKNISYSYTYRLRTANGEYRWVRDRGQPKFNAAGEFEGMVGTVLEVHEEKIKEQQIQDKEHRIRNIVEEATVATAVYTGKELKIEIANEAMISLWGKDKSVIGKNLPQALPELENQPFFDILRDVYSTGKIYWGQEDKVDLMIGDQMQTGYFNFTYKPLRNEKGEIYGILNMALDVTENVKSKLLLKESESYFRQIADLMPDKVTNTDEEGNFIYFNQNWLQYSGLKSEELNSRFWTDLIHLEDRELFAKKWQESLNTGKDFEIEARFRNKFNKYRWHLSRAEAVREETGKIKMWIGTNTEIHKLKEEEKRKEDFLKMVSHELKTPVTSIKGYVQLLLNMIKSGDEKNVSALPLAPSLERIDHQIIRLTRLISEMLDLSRLEENKLELQKEVFSINDLVTETVQDINYTNTQHKIEIIHDYKCNIFADKDRIGQVLINFITNAIKYSPESQNILVKIQKARNNQVSVSVRDHGIGIDRKNHKNIFKRFYRIGGKSEETYSGFGIGLYLANEIIQRHKGNITVKSKKGKGSDFSFVVSVASEK